MSGCNGFKATFSETEPMNAEFEETHQYTPIIPPSPPTPTPTPAEEVRDLLWKGSMQAPVASVEIPLETSLADYKKVGLVFSFGEATPYYAYNEYPLSLLRDHVGDKFGYGLFERYSPALIYQSDTSIFAASSAWNALVTIREVYGVK